MSSRPRTRGECIDGPRPCPHVSCRYHLVVEVTPAGSVTVHGRLGATLTEKAKGGVVDDFVEQAAQVVAEYQGDTCALDVADRGEATLETIAVAFHLTRERVRQVETKGMRRAALLAIRRGVSDGP